MVLFVEYSTISYRIKPVVSALLIATKRKFPIFLQSRVSSGDFLVFLPQILMRECDSPPFEVQF